MSVSLILALQMMFGAGSQKQVTTSQVVGSPKSGFRWCVRSFFGRNVTPEGTKYEEAFGDSTHWPIWPTTSGEIPVMFRLFHGYWHPKYYEINLAFGYGRSFIGGWKGDTLVLKTKRDSTKTPEIQILAEKKGQFVVVQRDTGKERTLDLNGYEYQGGWDHGGVRVSVVMDDEKVTVVRGKKKDVFNKMVNGKINWLY